MITVVGQSEPALDMVSIYGPWGFQALPQNISPSSQTFQAANTTIYYALDVPTMCVVKRFWWANGGTAAGNIIAALYRDGGYKPGARLGTTAATAQGTINQVQFAAPSGGDFTISPGAHWLALASSSASSTFFGGNMPAHTNAGVSFQEATATPPSSATPIERTGAVLYLFGFSTTTLT